MTETSQPESAHRSYLSLAFVCLFAVGILLRVVDIWQPIDQPSWREADVAGIARNFYQEGMNLFYPRIDWRGDGPGYAEMEFPLYPWMIAVLYKVFGYHEVIGRVMSYALSLATLGVYFKLAVYLLPPMGAFAASAFFVFGPLVVNISTSLQPDGLMMFCFVLAAYSFMRWLHDDLPKDYYMAMAITALAVLAKAPTALLGFLFAPLVVSEKGLKALFRPRMWIFAAVALAPAALWYAHARSFWFTYGNSLGVSNRIHFAGWQLFTDPAIILGNVSADIFYVAMPAGIIVLGFGIALRRAEKGVRYGLYWLGAVWVYYLVAGRTMSTEAFVYYHVLSVPPVGLLFGEGVEALRRITFRPSATAALWAAPVLLLTLLASGSSKLQVLSVCAGLGIVGITVMKSALSARWQAGLKGPFIGGASPLLSTIAVYLGVTFVFSTLLYEIRTVYQNQTSDRRTKLYWSAQAFKSAASEPGLIGASGGPCRDRGGAPQAYNASYMFYWMDRKGFNVCLEEQSASSLVELSRRGTRYYIFEKPYVLQPKAGLETKLRNAFPVMQETDVAVLFDLSSVSTASYALNPGPSTSVQSSPSPLK
jgi:hypothetical protein